jgi:hypothetical protein
MNILDHYLRKLGLIAKSISILSSKGIVAVAIVFPEIKVVAMLTIL